MKSKKLIAFLLTGMMTFTSLVTPVLAATPGGGLTSEAVLTQEVTRFNVTVPTILPVTVDAQNNVTVATDVTVKNDSIGPVKILGISKTEKNGWSLVETPTTKIGKKDIKFDISTVDSVIAANSSTAVVYSAKTSPQKSVITDEAALDVIFTVDWDRAEDEMTDSKIIAGKDKLLINEETALTLSNAGEQTITWTSSNPSVAKVVGTTRARTANDNEVVTGNEVQVKAINLGVTTITARNSEGRSFTKEIVVIENSLQSIYIETNPTKTVYKVGELFDPTNMVVKAVYLNGDEYVLDFYNYDKTPISAGQTSVSVNYNEKGIAKSVDVPITVEIDVVVKYNITKAPTTNGSFEVDKTTAVSGEIVKITITPDTGYRVASVKANDIDVKEQSFVVGDKDITVFVTFEISMDEPSIGTKFEDDTFEYRYGQEYIIDGDYGNFNWSNMENPVGWGVAIKSKNKSGKIASPLSEIKGYPVVNINNLYCNSTALTLDLSNWDTSNITSMDNVFGKTAAATINLTGWDTSKVETMKQMFQFTQAKNLDLTSFNTSNVKNMASMFYESKSEVLNLTSFDTSSVTDMCYMFSSARALQLDLINFNTSKVTNMNHMFSSANATTINTSNFNTSKVTNMGNMFTGIKSSTLDITSFDTSSVTDMRSMFSNAKISTLDVTSFDTSNVTNMSGMFYSTTSLTDLDLSSFDLSNVTSSSDMLTNIFYSMPAKECYARTQADANKLNQVKNKSPKITFIVRGAPATGEKYEDETFEYSYFQIYSGTSWITQSNQTGWGVRLKNKNMVGKIPSPLAEIKGFPVTNMSQIFNGSVSAHVDLSDWDTSNVTDMSYMFANSKINTLLLTGLDTNKVENMDNMFYLATTQELDLSGIDMSSVTNANYMFRENKATTINLNGVNANKLMYMLGMFYGSQAKTLDLRHFDTSNVSTMNIAFALSQATTIDVSSFDTSMVSDMANMFKDSKVEKLDLSSFTLMEGVKMPSMFQGSVATVGYAKTQYEANMFNRTSSKPTKLLFSVIGAPAIGEKYEDDTYEYSYCQSWSGTSWTTQSTQTGWGIRLKNRDQSGKIPSPLTEINGFLVTNASGLFLNSKATSLDLSEFNTKNITNTSLMFGNSQAIELDLSSFDTSKVEDMSSMFGNCVATKINLSSFATPLVSNTSSMFANSKVGTIDLSSFDVANITNRANMFINCKANKGYAKTTADATLLNYSITKRPSTLTFVIK